MQSRLTVAYANLRVQSFARRQIVSVSKAGSQSPNEFASAMFRTKLNSECLQSRLVVAIGEFAGAKLLILFVTTKFSAKNFLPSKMLQ